MFGYYYNSSIRRYCILLMELLNGIQIERNRDGEKIYKKVPVTYGSKERFVQKLNAINSNMSDYDIAKIETILPRINVHLVDMVYRPQAKTAWNVRKTNTVDNKTYQIFNPVPWKLMFEVSIWTRHETDMHVIVEQILPYFQPHFNCKIKELHDKNVVVDRNVPITLQSITMDEQTEGGSNTRRRIEWTLIFELDGWLYANFADLRGEIKTIYMDFMTNEKALPMKEYESEDYQVSPYDSTIDTWDRESVVHTLSEGKDIPSGDTPPKPRE